MLREKALRYKRIFIFGTAFLLFLFFSGRTDKPYIAGVWTKQETGVYKLLDGSNLEGVYARGIDVSHWQGRIDWKEVAQDDIQFAMIGTGYPRKPDPTFHYNAREASAAGIALGIYIYSYADTVAEAEAEADYVLHLIKDYPVSYPVAYDIEDERAHGKLSRAKLTEIVLAFTRKIENAGYHPMLYASDSWLSSKFDQSRLEGLDIWVARYHKRHRYHNPAIWQATNQGRVRGIRGFVDIDFQYKDFSAIIPRDTSRNIAGKTYHYKDYALYATGDMPQEPGEAEAADAEKSESASLTAKENKSGPGKEPHNESGWIKEGEDWYYLDAGKERHKGWLLHDSAWYYLDENGKMQTGWIEQNNRWYYLDQSGKMSTGLLKIDNQEYFLEEDGQMRAEGSVEIAGVQYLIDRGGALRRAEQGKGEKKEESKEESKEEPKNQILVMQVASKGEEKEEQKEEKEENAPEGKGAVILLTPPPSGP
ncbi:MAG: GH25 family lysozyme [Johnsonella sp.]|nr:GH25 family lysozyme [Johnsonella sp.]